MSSRRFVGLIVLLGLLLLTAGTLGAFAATNDVWPARLDDISQAITANALKPPDCAGISLTTIIVGSGTINGTSGNDLILGSSGIDTIRGRLGTDCILGGGGDDDIQGNQGNDVILGGPGNDYLEGDQQDDHLDGGSDADTCDGGAGSDTFNDCETVFP